MSLTRTKVTRKDSAETAVTKRSVSAAAANRRRVKGMIYGDVLMLRGSIMPATPDHDSLIKRHVYQTSRPAGAGFRAAGGLSAIGACDRVQETTGEITGETTG